MFLNFFFKNFDYFYIILFKKLKKTIIQLSIKNDCLDVLNPTKNLPYFFQNF